MQRGPGAGAMPSRQQAKSWMSDWRQDLQDTSLMLVAIIFALGAALLVLLTLRYVFK